METVAYQPWTKRVLALLAEIHSMPYLEGDLKNDIEVLFKSLGVDLNQITPTSLFKNQEMEGNPDLEASQLHVAEVNSGKEMELSLEVSTPPISGGHRHFLSQNQEMEGNPDLEASQLHVAEVKSGKAIELPLEVSTPPISGGHRHFLSQASLHCSAIIETSQSTRDALDRYRMIAQKGEISKILGIILKCASRDHAAFTVAKKVYKDLCENASNTTHVYACLAVLGGIADISQVSIKKLYNKKVRWVTFYDKFDQSTLSMYGYYLLIKSELRKLKKK